MCFKLSLNSFLVQDLALSLSAKLKSLLEISYSESGQKNSISIVEKELESALESWHCCQCNTEKRDLAEAQLSGSFTMTVHYYSWPKGTKLSDSMLPPKRGEWFGTHMTIKFAVYLVYSFPADNRSLIFLDLCSVIFFFFFFSFFSHFPFKSCKIYQRWPHFYRSLTETWNRVESRSDLHGAALETPFHSLKWDLISRFLKNLMQHGDFVIFQIFHKDFLTLFQVKEFEYCTPTLLSFNQPKLQK